MLNASLIQRSAMQYALEPTGHDRGWKNCLCTGLPAPGTPCNPHLLRHLVAIPGFAT